MSNPTSAKSPVRNTVRVKQLQGVSRRLNVIPLDPELGHYFVESVSHPDHVYRVTLDPECMSGRCTCPWGEHGGINCKHVFAALRFHYADEGTLSFWHSQDEALRQHRRIATGEGLYATVRPRRAS